jgi:hypothetical protein
VEEAESGRLNGTRINMSGKGAALWALGEIKFGEEKKTVFYFAFGESPEKEENRLNEARREGESSLRTYENVLAGVLGPGAARGDGDSGN